MAELNRANDSPESGAQSKQRRFSSQPSDEPCRAPPLPWPQGEEEVKKKRMGMSAPWSLDLLSVSPRRGVFFSWLPSLFGCSQKGFRWFSPDCPKFFETPLGVEKKWGTQIRFNSIYDKGQKKKKKDPETPPAENRPIKQHSLARRCLKGLLSVSWRTRGPEESSLRRTFKS